MRNSHKYSKLILLPAVRNSLKELARKMLVFSWYFLGFVDVKVHIPFLPMKLIYVPILVTKVTQYKKSGYKYYKYKTVQEIFELCKCDYSKGIEISFQKYKYQWLYHLY